MDAIAFNINNWFAISAGIESKQAWQQWHQELCEWPPVTEKIKADLIPPMMRRRMSNLSKIAVQTALQVSQSQQIDYIVFSSNHGELTRTASLLGDIMQGKDASPMAFSQSVHNTASGLFTIASERATPVTSIASTENGLPNAIIEAYCYLSEYPNSQVLVVDFDEPLPEIYQQYETQNYQYYALAMLINNGRNFTLSQKLNNKNTQPSLPHALQFINWLVSEQKTVQINSNKGDWQWKESDE